MEDDGLNDFDFSQPLQFALSQLNGDFPMEEEDEDDLLEDEDPYSHFPKPASLSSAAEDEQIRPRTTNEIIDELVENFDDYPKLVTIMMQRGLLKKRQQCRKCDRMMHLRRRKNSYEWRCRTRDKRGDCSSCSIKYGSWFEFTKLPFKTMFNFLIMHCKNCSIGHMVSQLKLSMHTVTEIRKVTYELSEKINQKYRPIGGYQRDVYLEVITIGCKKSPNMPEFTILAGQEVETKQCFAKLLADNTPATFEHVKKQNISQGSRVTMVVTTENAAASYSNQNAEFLDESTLTHGSDAFFANLRKPLPESVAVHPKLLQMYLNELVVRRVEGKFYLEKCVEEIRSYVTSSQ